jgi:hypothetical protein
VSGNAPSWRHNNCPIRCSRLSDLFERSTVMAKWMTILLVTAGLATFSAGCRVEGEVGETSYVPSVNLS